MTVLVSAEERASWELAAGHEALSSWVRRACEAFQDSTSGEARVVTVAPVPVRRAPVPAYKREVRPDPRKGDN